MKVKYIYSACIEIETKDIRVLTDPWFTEGAYDGSWYHFPKIEDPFSLISEPDYIYVSHIHPDHYDPCFLKRLFEKWGQKPILIPKFEKNYLKFKMITDGFSPLEIDSFSLGKTHLHITPNFTGSPSDIDSSLIVESEGKILLNLNDCIWNDSHVKANQKIIKDYGHRELDLLCLGYTLSLIHI